MLEKTDDFFPADSAVEELFGRPKAAVGMIHVAALPGSPPASQGVGHIAAQAVAEARTLAAAGFDALMIENMHDRPYWRQQAGPETVAAMTAVLQEVRAAIEVPVGVQILAGANREALAVALAGGGSFIRAENFVFAHVADEGLMGEADAARLLRYRREIGAEHIRVYADVKKKHASHAITGDLDIAAAAQAAAFFGADGVIVTGEATGCATNLADVRAASAAVELPVAIGSGLCPENLPEAWDTADVFIVGSFYKQDGRWDRPPDEHRLELFMSVVERLRSGQAAGARP